MQKIMTQTFISIAIMLSTSGISHAQHVQHPIEVPDQQHIRNSTERMILVRLYEAEHRLKEFTRVFLENNPSEQQANLNRVEAQMTYIRAILNAHTNSYTIMIKGLDVLEKYQVLLSQIKNENNNLQ